MCIRVGARFKCNFSYACNIKIWFFQNLCQKKSKVYPYERAVHSISVAGNFSVNIESGPCLYLLNAKFWPTVNLS